MPQPYSAAMNTGHVDTGTEIIHAPDINALAVHVNQLEVDANAGGPLDLPGHKSSSSADHDGRYIVQGASHTRAKELILLNPSGTFPLTPIPIFRATTAITVTAVYDYRVGGTSATINIRKVVGTTATTLLAADHSVPAAPPWASAGALVAAPATSLAVGDSLEIMFQTAVGAPTLVAVQVNFTEPLL